MFVYHGGRRGRNSDTSKFKEEHFLQPYFIRLRMLFTIPSIGVYCGNGSARHFRRTGVGWTPWELRCMQALSVGNVGRQHRGVMHLPCSPFRVPCCCSSSMRHPFLGISRRKKDEKIFFLVGGGGAKVKFCLAALPCPNPGLCCRPLLLFVKLDCRISYKRATKVYYFRFQ